MSSTTRSIDLLIELQALDRLPRAGFRLRGVEAAESVAEHSFHTAMLVWLCCREIDGIDRLRAIELALLHDIAEIRIGDLTRQANGYLPQGAKHGAELDAGKDLLQPVQGASDLLVEYQAGESKEARLVKVCDRLQLLIKATVYQRWGARGLGEFFDNIESFDDGGFAPVRRLLDELAAARRRRPR